MNESYRGWGFTGLKADLDRQAKLLADEEKDVWRELKVARWAADTAFPQAISRWVQEIGEKPEWK